MLFPEASTSRSATSVQRNEKTLAGPFLVTTPIGDCLSPSRCTLSSFRQPDPGVVGVLFCRRRRARIGLELEQLHLEPVRSPAFRLQGGMQFQLECRRLAVAIQFDHEIGDAVALPDADHVHGTAAVGLDRLESDPDAFYDD